MHIHGNIQLKTKSVILWPAENDLLTLAAHHCFLGMFCRHIIENEHDFLIKQYTLLRFIDSYVFVFKTKLNMDFYIICKSDSAFILLFFCLLLLT